MARTGLPIAIAVACATLFAAVAFVASRDEAARPRAPEPPRADDVAARSPRVSANAADAPAPASDDAAGAIPRPHALNGTVREQGGRALAGAVVRAEPLSAFPNVPEHRVAVEATADADGAFGLRGLSAGDWTLSVSAHGAVRAFAAAVRVPDVARFDLVVPRGAAVAGSLTDETTRAAVVGAHVRVVGPTDVVLCDAVTDRAGRFEVLTHREVSDVDRIEIAAPGYVRAPAPATECTGLRDGRRLEVALTARRGATLTGSVTGPDGPVAGARVALTPRFDFAWMPPRRETKTDAVGVYRFEHVDAEDYVVHAEAAGLVPEGTDTPEFARPDAWTSWLVPDAARVTVPEAGDVVLDVSMVRVHPFARCTIEGRVVDEDEHAVAGVRVFTLAGPLSVETTSDAGGMFVLKDVATGGESVEVALVSDGVFNRSVEAPAGGHTTDVVMVWSATESTPHARGRVVADGRGVAGARVAVVTSSLNEMHCFATGPFVHGAEGRTSEDGTFDIVFIRHGRSAAVVAEAPGFGTRIVNLDESDLLANPVEVVLPALVAFDGRVVRAGTDDGVAGAVVALVPAGEHRGAFTEDEDDTPSAVVAMTGADGAFRVAAVPAGEIDVVVSAPGWLDADATVTVPSATAARIEIAPAFRIAGRARFADGSPASGLEIAAFADDTPVDSEGAGPPAVTGADGSFACEGLAAGRFVLHVDGGAPRIVPRHAGPFDAGVADAVVDVVAGLTLRGTVRDLDGTPVDEAVVTLTSSGSAEPAGRATTKSAGTFVIDGLPAGVLALDVRSAACVHPPTRQVRGGTAPLDLRLDRGLSIEGVVLHADGKPNMFGNLSAEPVDAEAPAEARVIKADSAGAFRVTGLTRGRWKIVSGYNTTLAEEPVVEAGATHVEVRCAPPKKDDEAK